MNKIHRVQGHVKLHPLVTTEHVSSPGRVRADRSVQYVYLNPHLFAVITSGRDEAAEKCVLSNYVTFTFSLWFVVGLALFSVYLVDGVTGATIYHTTHRNAAGPVNIVLSENWIVVSH